MQKSAEETLTEYREQMGEELGSTHHALVGDLFSLHLKWNDYLALFGHSPERVATLNQTSGAFFARYQDILWNDIILHIARLTDAAKTAGKQNLSVQLLPELIEDDELSGRIKRLVEESIQKSAFARSWRNIVLAHRDHAFALKLTTARQLESTSRARVRECISSIEAPIHALEEHFRATPIKFEYGYDDAGEELIAFLEQSVRPSDRWR